MTLLEKALKKLEESKKEIIPKNSTEKSWNSKKTRDKSINETNVDFSNMKITQDDLWFLYRLKTGKGTRLPRKDLLPKFTEVFNINLNKIEK